MENENTTLTDANRHATPISDLSGANRVVVYNRHTTENQSAGTDEASLSGEQSGTTPSTSMNAPTQQSVGINSALDNTTDTGKTSERGRGNDTATPPSTVSGGQSYGSF